MTIEDKKMYSEVYSILQMLGEEYINKIPSKLYNLIKDERMEEYNPKYSIDDDIQKQDISTEAMAIIALIHLNYWCETQKEKDDLRELFKKNEEEYVKLQNEKYNPDNLFKENETNVKQEDIAKRQMLIVAEPRKNLFKKLIDMIKRIVGI